MMSVRTAEAPRYCVNFWSPTQWMNESAKIQTHISPTSSIKFYFLTHKVSILISTAGLGLSCLYTDNNNNNNKLTYRWLHVCSWRGAWRQKKEELCVLSHFSRVRLLVTPWTVAHQAPLSMGFSRQEYWSGLPCPPPQISDRPEFSSTTKWLSFSPKRTTEMCSISDHLVFTGEGERDALFSFHQDIQSWLLMSLD